MDRVRRVTESLIDDDQGMVSDQGGGMYINPHNNVGFMVLENAYNWVNREAL